MKIKLLQWNILYSEDITKVRDCIAKIDPDIACLQELTNAAPALKSTEKPIDFLCQSLGYHSFSKMAQTYQNPKLGSVTLGNAILTKFKPLETKYSFLQNPATENISPKNEGRVYIEVKVLIEDEPLTIGTTHLAYVPWFKELDFKKAEHAKLLNELDEHKERFVFTGDLNALPDGSLIDSLSNKLKSAGPGHETNTFTTKPFDMHGFQVNGLEYRLDYVFATADVKAHSSQVVDTDVSDHLPIVVEFEIN